VVKKETIIQAAMKLLTSNGVQATPMSAIAKEANTGMGTIYNYFATKEDLINAIYLYIKEDEVRSVMLSGSQDSIKRQFDHFYAVLVRYFIKNPLHFQFMDQFHNSPLLTEATKEKGMKSVQPFMELITKGQQQGIIKSIGFEELLQFLNGGLMGFVRWMLSGNKELTQVLLDNQLRIAWDAIKQ
jgi:AcrR family transcriptional regulator